MFDPALSSGPAATTLTLRPFATVINPAGSASACAVLKSTFDDSVSGCPTPNNVRDLFCSWF
jgi:hypothetical protein